MPKEKVLYVDDGIPFEEIEGSERKPRSKFVAWLLEQEPEAGRAFTITTTRAREFIPEESHSRIATMAGFKLWLGSQLNSKTMKREGYSFTVEASGRTPDGSLAVRVRPERQQ